MSDNPAVDVAKERRQEGTAVEVLSTGVRARLCPVSASLVDEVRSRIPVPKVPKWHNPDTERDEENPNDPAYTRALEEYNHALGLAAIDAMVMFGVQLIDPIPEDGKWIKSLKRLGIEVDATDPDEVEFAYKKYVAVAQPDIVRLGVVSGVNKAAMERAAATF